MEPRTANRFRSIVLFTAMTLILASTCSYGQPESGNRPRRGTITFGAKTRKIATLPADIEIFKRVFVRVAREVIPSVVSVVPTVVDTVLFYRNPFYRFFGEEQFSDKPYDFFFGPPDENGNGDGPPVEKRERRQQTLGSGVIISPEGYILTNYHVIAGATEIEIRLSDNRIFQARVAGADSLSDVAVVRITGTIPDNLPVIFLGNSDSLEPGDWVAAIGNPFSLTSTVTAGIVSALGRQVGEPTTMYQNFIQTDAAINPGNSGGALVNVFGELVGINTLIYSRTGGFMGIGFAIPINMARRAMEDLIYEGKVTRGWIGVSIQELTPVTREALDVDLTTGVLISDVFAGQPAARAGIRRGDVVVEIGGQQIATPNDLRNVVAAIRPGIEVPVIYMRDGRRRETKIEVAERTPETVETGSPGQRGEKIPLPRREEVTNRIGIEVADITRQLRERFGIASDIRGAIVLQISPSVNDARTGLAPGDVILEAKIEGRKTQEIRSRKQFQAFSNSVKEGQSVLLLAVRDGNTFYIAFVMGKAT